MKPSKLSPSWEPGDGDGFTWVAMDRLGRLAVLSNNGSGGLPDCLLTVQDVEFLLDELMSFLDDESEKFEPFNIHGSFSVDLYSSWFYRSYSSKLDVQERLQKDFDVSKRRNDVSLSADKGMYVYQALDHGNIPNERPIGYAGEVSNGDYYRNIVPTIFSTINDIPATFRRIVAVSNTLSFSEAALITSHDVKKHFQELFGSKR